MVIETIKVYWWIGIPVYLFVMYIISYTLFSAIDHLLHPNDYKKANRFAKGNKAVEEKITEISVKEKTSTTEAGDKEERQDLGDFRCPYCFNNVKGVITKSVCDQDED